MGTLHRRDLNGSNLTEDNYGMRQGKYRYDANTVYNWIGAYKAASDVKDIDFTTKQIKSFVLKITADGGFYGSNHPTKELGILVGQNWDNVTNTTMKNYLNNITKTSSNFLLLTINSKGSQSFTIKKDDYTDFFAQLNSSFRAGKKTLIFFNPDDYKVADNNVPTGSGNYTDNYMSATVFSLSNFQLEDAFASIQSPPTEITLGSNVSVTLQDAQSRKYSVSWSLGGTTITSAISTSKTHTADIRSFGAELPTSFSGPGSIIVKTYDSNSNLLGSVKYSVTFKIPNYTLSTSSWSASYTNLYYSKTNNTYNSLYVGGESEIVFSGEATASYGATLYWDIYQNSNIIKTINSNQLQESIIFPVPQQDSQSINYSVTLRDSRNETYSVPSQTVLVTKLSDLIKVNTLTIGRCGADGQLNASGSYLKVKYSLESAQIKQVQYKDKVNNTYINCTARTTSAGENNYYRGTSSQFDPGLSYEIKIDISSTNYYKSKNANDPVMKSFFLTLEGGEYLLHFSSTGKAIGLGCVSEEGEVINNVQQGQITTGWPVKFKKGFILPTSNNNSEPVTIQYASDLGGTTNLPGQYDSLSITTLTGVSTINSFTYYPIAVVGSLPPSPAQNVIYFVKSST